MFCQHNQGGASALWDPHMLTQVTRVRDNSIDDGKSEHKSIAKEINAKEDSGILREETVENNTVS